MRGQGNDLTPQHQAIIMEISLRFLRPREGKEREIHIMSTRCKDGILLELNKRFSKFIADILFLFE